VLADATSSPKLKTRLNLTNIMDRSAYRLFELCKNEEFDIAEAEKIISPLDINRIIIVPGLLGETKTTFLIEASSNSNLKMVKLLLEHGADPNMICNYENPLWDLQYNDYSDDEYEKGEEVTRNSDEKRLKIAQLMLEYGADPCMIVEDEDLFSYVLFAVFNDDPGHLRDYRSRFFILLIAYGGKNSYCNPKILKPFDKSNMHQYAFLRVPVGDGYHLTGEIVDENHEVVAKV